MGTVLYRVVKESMCNKVTSEQQPEACETRAKWVTGKGFQTEGIRRQTFSGRIMLMCSKRAQRLELLEGQGLEQEMRPERPGLGQPR